MPHYTLHGMVILHSNALSDLRIAAEAGFQGLELHTEKLWRYLRAGGTAADYKEAARRWGISITAIDIIGDVEWTGREAQTRLRKQAHELCRFAQEVGCPLIQLNAFCALDGLSLEQNLEITAQNISQLCAIGRDYGVGFQYEGAAWAPIHSLRDCVRLVDMANAPNLGLVIDFWHLWASRGATPQELATLDLRYIFGVHVCDGLRPPLNPEGKIAAWEDESTYRKFLPGEGDLPVTDWINAVKNTGYTGSYSGEILNPLLWEQDHLDLARKMKLALSSFWETS
ncbi:MAG: sugar phosphate isomerase/epimerase family protein [Spirochaetota bacterium]